MQKHIEIACITDIFLEKKKLHPTVKHKLNSFNF